MIQGHPTEWVGKTFKSKTTGDILKVLRVEKNHSRYSIKMDSDNDWFRYLGFDSRQFRTNWELLKD